MAEPVAKTHPGLPDDGPAPQTVEFPGCRPVRIRRDELDDYEGRSDATWSYRPKSRRSALTILVLEAGGYVEAASSRAFPGWTAEAIHTALNEPETSLATVDVLRRVGGNLGAAEGTTAGDDPFLGRELAHECRDAGDFLRRAGDVR